MPRNTSKRELILDLAMDAILTKGFAGTSIDELIVEAGISKNGFFYHFKDKNALARALLQRYLDTEEAVLDEAFEYGRNTHTDPLKSFLSGLEYLADMMSDLPSVHPGCLVATIAYSERMYDNEVKELNRTAIFVWRKRFLAMLEDISEKYEANAQVDLKVIADMVSSTIEGGIVVSRAINDPKVLSEQIRALSVYIGLLFESPSKK